MQRTRSMMIWTEASCELPQGSNLSLVLVKVLINNFYEDSIYGHQICG
jgi:hypothetical protein